MQNFRPTHQIMLLLGSVALSACLSSSQGEANTKKLSTDSSNKEAKPMEVSTMNTYTIENKLGAQGYDIISYFEENQARKGSSQFHAEYQGIQYYFVTQEHKDTFLKNPEKFLPAYGGYCAFAVAMKEAKVPPNPETFRVQDGRLLLFFNGEFEGNIVNTLPMWNENPEEMQEKAKQNWPKLIQSHSNN